jgi:sugar phosphate isomerase/epimerase
MKIGCQTITFGNETHKSDMRGIIEAVALAGYDGMETGFFRLDASKAEQYRKCQLDHSIKQAAIHMGGNFSDAESVKNQIENIPNLIKLAHSLECENIFVSGSPAGANYMAAAENINRLGRMLKENGLALSYHNHDWEAKKDGCDCYGLYTICDNTDPEYVSFVPDVGWLAKGGTNPVDVLKRLGSRVSNLHFKEFTSEGKFTELGRGIVDFRGVYEFMKKYDFWIIAEQDESQIGAKASIAENFAYIKSLMN